MWVRASWLALMPPYACSGFMTPEVGAICVQDALSTLIPARVLGFVDNESKWRYGVAVGTGQQCSVPACPFQHPGGRAMGRVHARPVPAVGLTHTFSLCNERGY